MLAAHVFDQTRDLFFLVLRACRTGRLLRVHTLKQCEEVFACLFAIHNRYRFQENAVLHGFGF